MLAARILCALALMLIVSANVHAQTGTSLAEPRARFELTLPASSTQPLTGRDSVKNGAIIGAVVAGVAAFAFGMYLCHAIREEGDPPCLKPALVLTAAAAAGGAAAGAGIDALLTRRVVVRFSVRF
jgi:hypothetical protein